MSELEQLYLALKTGENIPEITQRTLEIYDNPESILEIINILKNQADVYIRSQASIQLKTALNRSLQKFPDPEMLKAAFLDVLANEQQIYIRKQFIHSIDNPLIMNSSWIQIWEFSSALIQTQSPINIETSLILLYCWIKTIQSEQFASISDQIGQYVIASISSNNADIQIAGYKLFAQSIAHFNSPLQPPFTDILTQFLVTYKELLVKDDQIAFQFGSILDNILHSNFESFNSESIQKAIEFNQIMPILLSILADQNISSELSFSIIFPIQYLIASTAISIEELKVHLEEIVKAILFRISLSLNEECYSQQSLGWHASNLILDLCYKINPTKLFHIIVNSISENTPNELYTKILVFNSFIDFSLSSDSSVCIKNSSLIASTLIKCLDPSIPHTLYEAALATLILLIQLVENELTDFLQPIVQGCIQALSSNHRQLIFYALKTLTIALDSIEFDSEYPKILVPLLCKFGEYPDAEIVKETITAISSLVYGAENDIIEYIPQFLPLFSQAASLSEEENALIKGEALKTISKIISLAPVQSESCIKPILQILNECTQSQDPSLIADLITSFTFLIRADSDEIRQCLPSFTEFSIQQMELMQYQKTITDENYNCEEESPDHLMDLVDIIIKSLKFVEELAKFIPDLLAPYVEKILKTVQGYIDWEDQSDTIPQCALSTLAALIITYKFDPNPYFESLITLFDSLYPVTVCSMFDFICALIDMGFELHPNIIGAIYLKSLEAIEHKLPCYENDGKITEEVNDEEEEIDDDLNNDSKLDLVKTVFKFLSTLVSKLPGVWDINVLRKFIDSIKRAIKKKYELEIMYSTGILGQLFEVNRGLFENLVLKYTKKICVDYSKLCDGTNRPVPLVALRRILGTDPTVLQSSIPEIIVVINSILGLENIGQPYYRETLATAVAFLFELLKIQGDQFPFDPYFPQMLAALPSRYESEYTLNTLVALFSSSPVVFQNSLDQLIRILAQVLALKDSDLEKYKLSQETLMRIKTTLAQILSTVENAQSLIPTVVPDEKQREILQSRLSS